MMVLAYARPRLGPLGSWALLRKNENLGWEIGLRREKKGGKKENDLERSEILDRGSEIRSIGSSLQVPEWAREEAARRTSRHWLRPKWKINRRYKKSNRT